MAKRTSIVIWALFLLTAIIIIVGVFVYINNKKINSDIKEIDSFRIGDYQDYLEYSSTDNLGPIENVDDLLKKVETTWISKYGECIKKETPYVVLYDEESKVWLVHGSLRSNNKGGVAYILVDDSTGNVLAMWHEK